MERHSGILEDREIGAFRQNGYLLVLGRPSADATREKPLSENPADRGL